ncbi:NusG domain II-containing protein [Keratinibaculum paraultunense]|uniref:NusG domain II-containing protein n=1 Tax=Caproiciproducens sp. MSJ-32 TaxID=2841527 RepID=UPI00192BF564|nr:NusG domain II-containing protein [Caproiciproducens sp. MSJ-32]MBU5455443.1 NusG domain II-containing protein [Caproiciproducens sp. MSJ-32]QQY80826.1 NusG domain II-containing protein [Keratinibaculum paraultunense]
MTKGDKYLIVFIIIISLLSLVYVNKSALNYNKKYISIQVDGKEIKKIIFDKNIIGKTIPIKTEFGYNLIEIGDEKVRVIEADCPDKLDVKQGYISKVGEVIVCLPNKLVIEIKGIDDERDVDYISY